MMTIRVLKEVAAHIYSSVNKEDGDSVRCLIQCSRNVDIITWISAVEPDELQALTLAPASIRLPIIIMLPL